MLIFAIVELVKAGRMFLDFGTRDRDLSDMSAPDAARANKKPTPLVRDAPGLVLRALDPAIWPNSVCSAQL